MIALNKQEGLLTTPQHLQSRWYKTYHSSRQAGYNPSVAAFIAQSKADIADTAYQLTSNKEV